MTDWQHLNTAPRDKEFLANSRGWKRPRFVKMNFNGEYRCVTDGRIVVPQAWFDLPRLAK